MSLRSSSTWTGRLNATCCLCYHVLPFSVHAFSTTEKKTNSCACATTHFKLQKTCKVWHVIFKHKIHDMTIPDQSGKLYV